MSTYKVIQDIEAEDKLLGPLTLRQFVYAGASAISLYLCYFLATRGLSFMLIIFLPIALVGAFFAFPWGRDQPTEIWALAKIRFLLKPRRRIWNQDGIKELVTITAPKQIETHYTNGLSQSEVRSRLHALADTIDSRGWAIKNSNINMFGQPALVMDEPNSDRLLQPTAMPQQQIADVQASDDILDEKNNARAQRVDSMIAASEKAHRQKIMDNLRSDKPVAPKPTSPNNYWFLNQPAQAASIPNNMVTFNTQVVTPGATQEAMPAAGPAITKSEEENIVHELEAHKSQSPTASYYGHLHTIQPLSAQAHQPAHPPHDQPSVVPAQTQQPPQAVPVPPPLAATPVPTPPPVTPTSQAAILNLASNDDLNVATIAREASRSSSDGEVVIKLH